MSQDQGFYEDDEPIEEIRAAWKRGEPGQTAGSHDLSQRARSVVEQAVAEWDAGESPVEPDENGWVNTDGWFAPAGSRAPDTTRAESTTPNAEASVSV